MVASKDVRVECPSYPDRAYTFPTDGTYVIGRASEGGPRMRLFDLDMRPLTDLTLGHISNHVLSRQHALIEVGPLSTIQDYDSLNGLFHAPTGDYQGDLVRIVEPFALTPGVHVVCFGNNECRVPLRIHVRN